MITPPGLRGGPEGWPVAESCTRVSTSIQFRKLVPLSIACRPSRLKATRVGPGLAMWKSSEGVVGNLHTKMSPSHCATASRAPSGEYRTRTVIAGWRSGWRAGRSERSSGSRGTELHQSIVPDGREFVARGGELGVLAPDLFAGDDGGEVALGHPEDPADAVPEGGYGLALEIDAQARQSFRSPGRIARVQDGPRRRIQPDEVVAPVVPIVPSPDRQEHPVTVDEPGRDSIRPAVRDPEIAQ